MGRDRGATRTAPLPRCCRHGAEQGRKTLARAAGPRYDGAVAGGPGVCPSTGWVPRCSAPLWGARGPLDRALWDREQCQWGTMLPAPVVPHSPCPGLSGHPAVPAWQGLCSGGSEMTPHCSWQQHLPRPFWGSPGIQLHWENLWEREHEDQCQVFVPGVSPCLEERYVGQKYLSTGGGGSQQSYGQPLPWAQALLHPQVPSLPLVPAEVAHPGALPRLAGPAVVRGQCSVLPGCPWAESLCDRGDTAQPVLARGSVPRWSPAAQRGAHWYSDTVARARPLCTAPH